MKVLSFAALMIASFISLAQTINYNIYDPGIGEEGLYYSAAAYCDYLSVQEWNCGSPCQNNRFLTDVELIRNKQRLTFGYVGYNYAQNEIVVAFRGTNGLYNWRRNFKAWYQQYPGVDGAKVHVGFQQHYDGIKDQLIKAVRVRRTSNPSAKIFVTGHSLGGAIALLAAANIKDKFNTEVTLYTYGQPRVGNEVFSNYIFDQLDGYYVRVINGNDLVPHLLGSIYKHAGNEVWFNKGQIQECQNEAGLEENHECSDSLPSYESDTRDIIYSHNTLMGVSITEICDHAQPEDTVLSSLEILETDTVADQTNAIDKNSPVLKSLLSESVSLE